MNIKNSELVSSYQQYLPAILQENLFIGQFLLAFEKILSGLNETSDRDDLLGLEEIIDRLHLYFDPQQTPEEFLPWLAGWVALSLRDDWEVDVKREFIRQIVGLYRWRGTKTGLEEILRIYLTNSGFGDKVSIFDRFDDFPNYFQVQLTLNDRDPDRYWRQTKIAKAIIDREKPAQTFYTLKILVPTMQLTKRSEVAYPFKLFNSIPEQKFAIEVKITPDQSNSSSLDRLAKKLVIRLEGNSQSLNLDSPEVIIGDRDFIVKYELNYQHFPGNLEGFNIQISNLTDNSFTGNLAIKLYFYINEIEHNNLLLEQSLNLSSVLKICRLNNAKEVIEGNTIFQQTARSSESGMRITQSIWTQPYIVQTFAAPKIQELQPNIIAIIDRIDLEAIVEITQPTQVTTDLLNKITVRLKDDVSELHLLIPETNIENNKIKIKRTLYYQQFMQTIDRLQVTIKNLNNIAVVGKVTVTASLTINRSLSTYQLLEQDFNLEAVANHNILRICRKSDRGEIIKEDNNTILGTTNDL
jgi:phage tail-like protein